MAVSAKAENTICYFLKDMDKKHEYYKLGQQVSIK